MNKSKVLFNALRIFEGDIVRVAYKGWNFEVAWDDNNARFIFYNDGLVIGFEDLSSCEVMVIGNVYDNPDMIVYI